MSAELVNQLFGLVVRACHERLSPSAKPASAEVLGISRKLLRDSGHIVLPSDEATHKQLRAMHSAYVLKLAAALEGSPSASVLAEVRQFLTQSGVTKDVRGSLSSAQAVTLLADTRIPFKSN